MKAANGEGKGRKTILSWVLGALEKRDAVGIARQRRETETTAVLSKGVIDEVLLGAAVSDGRFQCKFQEADKNLSGQTNMTCFPKFSLFHLSKMAYFSA